MFNKWETYKKGIRFSSLELDGYFIDYAPSYKNILFITFENADQPRRPRLDRTREAWGIQPLNSLGYCVLGIKPKAVDWYRGHDLHEFFRSTAFAAFRSSFEKIIFYGSSMGGYAALTFAAACPGADVLAINPQSTLDPTLVPWEPRYPEGKAQDWSGDFSDAAVGAALARQVYVAYDPLFKWDRKHVERLPDINLIKIKTPLLGHSLPVWLHQMGVLKEVIVRVSNGSLDQNMCNILARRRKNIARYYIGMAAKTRSKHVASSCIQNAITNYASTIDHHSKREILKVCITHDLLNFAADFAKELLQSRVDVVVDAIGSARKLMHQGNYELALDVVETVKRFFPHNIDCHILIAEIHYHNLNILEAEELIRKVVADHPDSAHAHRLLGRILWQLGCKEEAISVACKATKLDEKNFIGLWEYGSYLMEQSLYRNAAIALKNAVALYPSHPQASAKLACCLEKLQG